MLATAALCELVADAAAAEVALPAAVVETPAAVVAAIEVEAPLVEAVEATEATLLDAPEVKLDWLVMVAVRPVPLVHAEPIVVFMPAT